MARLLRLKALAERQDPDLHGWLSDCLQRLRMGEKFESAFDLTGRGAERAMREALLQAAELLDPTREKSCWQIARQLALAIERFERRTWPRVRALEDPSSLAGLDRAIWEVFTCRSRVPRSARQLDRLLTDMGWTCQSKPAEDGAVQRSTEEPAP